MTPLSAALKAHSKSTRTEGDTSDEKRPANITASFLVVSPKARCDAIGMDLDITAAMRDIEATNELGPTAQDAMNVGRVANRPSPALSLFLSIEVLYITVMSTNVPQKVTRQSPPEEKIALFGALFRGRDDVYPRRFESVRTGRSGYQPACANEWVRGVCEKPKTRCALCGQRKFLPVTEETIRWHLSGMDDKGRPFVMGLYPLRVDEHCHFVAADFDKDSWREDVGAVARTCSERGLPVAVERSRSGNGAHLWWFFSEPLPGRLAREFASWILTETLEGRPEVGLDSYDRLFPNQDTLPKGGFGNLIALPLQKQARILGNSAFVDERFEPF